MFDKIKSFFGISAATRLPTLPPPKVRPGPRSFPSFLTTTRPSDSTLPRQDRRLATTDTLSYRSGPDTRKIMRDFASASPDLSAAIFSYCRLAIPNGYGAVARNLDGTANPEATLLLQQLLTRFEALGQYDDGFSGTWSLQSISESLARELLLYGAASAELVLDKTRLPQRIQPISTTTIDFYPDGKILRPEQRVGGDKIDLDTPCFVYVHLDQNLLEPYSESPMESSLRQVILSEDLLADLWRVIKRSVHPRQLFTIDEEKFNNNAPGDAEHDLEKLTEYKNRVLEEVRAQVSGLAPEEALVLFDSIKADYMNNGNISYSDELKAIMEIINARLATGSKTLPAVLGRANSSNIASTESMIFVKNAGVIKRKLEEVYSRLLTIAVRLFGYDVSVSFQYDAIDLRPENELMSFKQTEQSMVLEQLSLGMITDEEACLRLTRKLPPNGYKPLSGTMFKTASAQSAGGMGPNNDASTPSNSGSTLNQKMGSDQPAQGRGGNKKAEVVVDIRSAV